MRLGTPLFSEVVPERASQSYHHRKTTFRKTLLPSQQTLIPKAHEPGKPYLPPKSFLYGPHFFRRMKDPHWSQATFRAINNKTPKQKFHGIVPGLCQIVPGLSRHFPGVLDVRRIACSLGFPQENLQIE